jgi:hypothetical protein
VIDRTIGLQEDQEYDDASNQIDDYLDRKEVDTIE